MDTLRNEEGAVAVLTRVVHSLISLQHPRLPGQRRAERARRARSAGQLGSGALVNDSAGRRRTEEDGQVSRASLCRGANVFTFHGYSARAADREARAAHSAAHTHSRTLSLDLIKKSVITDHSNVESVQLCNRQEPTVNSRSSALS